MSTLLYVVLFIVFSPKFFFVLAKRRTASVTMADILFHALLFALGLYVVGYLTRTYHIFEGYTDVDCPSGRQPRTAAERKACSREAQEHNQQKKRPGARASTPQPESNTPNRRRRNTPQVQSTAANRVNMPSLPNNTANMYDSKTITARTTGTTQPMGSPMTA